MADWPTVGIAAVSALAGIGGTWLTNRHNDKSRKRADAREDSAHLRTRFEELFEELDQVQATAGVVSVQLLQVLQDPGHAQTVEPQRSLGKVRSFVALYFPDCADLLAAYDVEIAALGTQLRTDIEGGMDRAAALGGFALLSVQRSNILAGQLRDRLQAIAPALANRT